MNLLHKQPFLFIGLGNPGKQYEKTRHNMGFLVVQALAHQVNCSLKESRQFQALTGKEIVKNRLVHFLLPVTYMNLSGVAVKYYIDYFKIPISQIVVVTDDIALPYAQLRVKTTGSAGGHNGLKSVESHIGTTDYMRLRMGIGHPVKQTEQKKLSDYVLEVFNLQEMEILPQFIEQGVDVLKRLLIETPSCVMNTVNSISFLLPLEETKGKLKDQQNPPL